jgi:hypothetical protein
LKCGGMVCMPGLGEGVGWLSEWLGGGVGRVVGEMMRSRSRWACGGPPSLWGLIPDIPHTPSWAAEVWCGVRSMCAPDRSELP